MKTPCNTTVVLKLVWFCCYICSGLVSINTDLGALNIIMIKNKILSKSITI